MRASHESGPPGGVWAPSFDGYVEGPGRDVIALPMDRLLRRTELERLRSADTLLLGATTYTGLKGYWPAVAETSEVSIAVIANPDVADLLPDRPAQQRDPEGRRFRLRH